MSARDAGCYRSSGRGKLPWRWLTFAMLVLLLAVVTTSCGGGGDDDDGNDGAGNGSNAVSDTQLRLQFIQTIGNGFIVPTYTAMEAAAGVLIDSAEQLCETPDRDNLDDAQEQWQQVVGLWTESELVKFGPARQDFIYNYIDAPNGVHADALGIEAKIAGDDPIDSGLAATWPVNERGLEGTEYLLFGNPADADAVILETTAATWPRRCDYLKAIVDDLHTNIKTISDDWQASEGDYIGQWNSAGDADNATYPFVQDAIDDLMNEVELVMDDLVNNKLNEVRWVSDVNEEGEPERKPESWRSGNSIANLRHRIEAVEMIYLGIDRNTDEDQYGMDDYLQQTGETGLDGQIRAQFGVALDALDALPGTLEDAVKSHPTLVDNAEKESRILLRLLKRDLAEHLDVFFGFNDADGD